MKTRNFVDFAAAFFAAGSAAAEPPAIDSPWARATVGASRPGVAYLTIRNGGSETDTLLRLETPAAARSEAHETVVDASGVSRMRPATPLPVPAGGEVAFAPGGLQVMLMGLSAPLAEGDSFPLTLVFERAGAVTVDIPVRAIGATGPAD